MISFSKMLPSPTWDSLRWFYHRFRLGVVWDVEIIQDLGEYYGIEPKDAMRYLAQSKELNKHLWTLLNPKTQDDITHFYMITPFYVFQLSFWHMKEYQRAFRDMVLELSKGDVLDYGGGTGDLSFRLSKIGHRVTYADLGGHTFKFAKWRFQKHDLSVETVDLLKAKPESVYDTVICIDVIEHVPNPRMLLSDLATYIRKGGTLILTNLNLGEDSKDDPMHKKIGFDAEEYLESLGFERKEFPWLWKKV